MGDCYVGSVRYNPFGQTINCNPTTLEETSWEKVAEATLRDLESCSDFPQGFNFNSLSEEERGNLVRKVAEALKKANGDRPKPFPNVSSDPDFSYKRYLGSQCPSGIFSSIDFLASGAVPGINLPSSTISEIKVIVREAVDEHLNRVCTPSVTKVFPSNDAAGGTTEVNIVGENFGEKPKITIQSNNSSQEFTPTIHSPGYLKVPDVYIPQGVNEITITIQNTDPVCGSRNKTTAEVTMPVKTPEPPKKEEKEADNTQTKKARPVKPGSAGKQKSKPPKFDFGSSGVSP